MPADKASKDPILFSSLKDVGIFKIDGRGSMNNVHLFMRACSTLIGNGLKRIVVDFNCCIGLDSTFMGTLVEVDDKLKAVNGELLLIQVNPKVKELLDMLGVLEIVKITDDLALPSRLSFEPIDQFEISHVERIKLIHQAHKRLVESYPENEAQFGNFLRALESELDED